MADLNEDMARESSLRLVSLTRLETEVAKRIAEGQPVIQTMKHLAGLSQIQFVFVYPEEGDDREALMERAKEPRIRMV